MSRPRRPSNKVKNALKNLEPKDKKLVDSINEMLRVERDPNASREEYQTCLNRVFGQSGKEFDDKPPQVVDALGRVIKPENDSKPELRLLEGGIEKGQHRVTLIKDHALEFPQLFLEVFLTGPEIDRRGFPKMFARSHCQLAKSLRESDLVVFTGGADVNPALYGADKHKTTWFSDARDTEDIGTYMECLEQGIPMLGICRGAQFLHVMNGGKLYQDVDNHQSEHPMWDLNRKMMVDRVSSVHHQMCIENIKGGMEVLGTSSRATHRWKDPLHEVSGSVADVEAFFYRDTCCIGVQGHPEYSGYSYFTKWVLDLLNELVLLNPDIDWVQIGKNSEGKAITNRRLKPELVEERRARLRETVLDNKEK